MSKKTTKGKKQKKATPFTTLKKGAGKASSGDGTAKAPKDDRVVFAFRLTKDERDLIHEAAGPRGASRFVLEAALAAAASAKSLK